MRRFLLLCGLLLFAQPAFAQFTLVSGSVNDPQGVPYSGATLTASLVLPGGTTGAYLNGAQISGSAGPVQLTTAGTFVMQLADNNQIKCGNTQGQLVTCSNQWAFAVNESPGVAPPVGTGPQVCNSTLTITGANQTVVISPCPSLTTVSGGGSGNAIPTKTLYVDNQRTDSYTQNGSKNQPFKTIMGAVNQVITNGDNASVCYAIDISSGNYNELIVLENLALACLAFDGHETAILTGGSAGIRSQVNNNNLTGANTTGIGVVFLHFPAVSPGGTFAITFQNSATQWEVRECTWSLNSFALSASAAQPQLNIYDSIIQIGTLTVNATFMGFFNSSHAAGGTAAITGGGQIGYNRGSRNSGTNVTVDATSTLALSGGARMDGTVTDNGSLINRQGLITGAITVNSGATYTESTGAHTGTLTVNGGGTYTPTATQIGGANGQLQYNNNGAFGALTNFTQGFSGNVVVANGGFISDTTGNSGITWANPDLALSALSGGIVNASGFPMKANTFLVGGTQNISGCGLTLPVGGASAGKFASGTTGTCTITITISPSSAHGWTCDAHDLTTTADANNVVQTAFTTSSATMSGTTVSGDTITYKCTGW